MSIEVLKVAHPLRRTEPGTALQSASEDIWDRKYRLKDKAGSPIDETIDATYRRVARALAEIERDGGVITAVAPEEILRGGDRLVFVGETDEVPEGAIVVFSAHGVSPAVHESAAQRKLQTIDATCPLVTKVHRDKVASYVGAAESDGETAQDVPYAPRFKVVRCVPSIPRFGECPCHRARRGSGA